MAHRVAKTAVTGDDVKRLEDWIDLLESEVPPLRRFILAGGSSGRVAARRAHDLPPRRTDGRRARTDARRARDPRILEPPVRSAVRHGASRRTAATVRPNSSGEPRRGVRSRLRAVRARAREHYENFPVASRLLPKAMRPHIAAIYAFARTADDFADEPGIAKDERLRLLDAWERLAAQRRRRRRRESSADPQTILIFRARETIRDCRLPFALRGSAERVPAGRDDDALRHVGRRARLLPAIGQSGGPARAAGRGYDDARLDAQSDAVCTALQLTNFWQDLERDWAIGRLYVPRDDRTSRARARKISTETMTPSGAA